MDDENFLNRSTNLTIERYALLPIEGPFARDALPVIICPASEVEGILYLASYILTNIPSAIFSSSYCSKSPSSAESSFYAYYSASMSIENVLSDSSYDAFSS